MAADDVRRIHRGLFVHSMGFYELVRTAAKPCKGSAMIMLSIWTVFSKFLKQVIGNLLENRP